ncbi:MAG: peptidoglycan DD-metalloendopeptidase family protein [Candidatus Nanopelagicales bacterium]
MAARRSLAAALVAVVAVGALAAMPVASQAAPAKPRTPAFAAGAPELSTGSKGEPVRVLQRALDIEVTGYFGPVTRIAVVKLQQANDLEPTGVVGAETWAVLGRAIAREAAAADETFGDVQVDGRYCPAVDFRNGDGLGAGRNHQGFDLLGTRGTPIYAVDAGRVTRSGFQGNGALILDITDKKGSMWFYGHFDKIFVGRGDTVKAGQLIGTMGDTGSPGAVHLHIELRPRGWSGPAQDARPVVLKLCAGADSQRRR